MHAFLIHNDADLTRAVALVDSLWDAAPGSPEHELLHVMSTLIDQYEARHSSLPSADPVEILAFKLRELGWSQRELGRRLGWSTGRVSEVLGRKRPLTLRMVRELSLVLNLEPGLLVHDVAEPDGYGRWLQLSPLTAGRLERLAKQAGLTPELLVNQLLNSLDPSARASTGSDAAITTVVADRARACQSPASQVSAQKVAA